MAQAADHRVGPGTTVNRIVPRAADNGIVERAAVEGVSIIVSGQGNGSGAGVIDILDVCARVDRVDRIVCGESVIAATANNGIPVV